MRQAITEIPNLTVGLDLGDQSSEVCGLNACGEVEVRKTVQTTKTGLQKMFDEMKPCLVAIEVGTHSPWVKRLLESLGHEVVVANPRQVRLIHSNPAKSDRMDAELLARLARFDHKLLSPVTHRSAQCQQHLTVLRSRDALVRCRTLLINSARGTAKAFGLKLPTCSSAAFHRKARAHVVGELEMSLGALLDSIEALTNQIQVLERTIHQVASKHYPQVELVTQPTGVGVLTGLRFVLTVENPGRFHKNRSVGPYLGMTPRRDQSGRSDPQLHITKAGDADMRSSLVNAAHYILGPFGPDCDLRRFGEKLAQRGGSNAKKRAVVAVARRLAVLMLCLWKTGQVYDPLLHARASEVPA